MKKVKLPFVGILFLSFVCLAGTIDLQNLFEYTGVEVPDYAEVFASEPLDNPSDDKIATLGRVLFYDRKLSSDNTVSCGSCHQQDRAFGLEALQGQGVNGLSKRRPMRLLNLQYRELIEGLFWDERATSLESLATQPIRDHIEMGYSGQNGAPLMEDLIEEMSNTDYYPELFDFAFGDSAITEDRMAKALAQFIRSIISYDSRFDQGLALTGGDQHLDFPNFSEAENAGKSLFNAGSVLDSTGARIGGGTDCASCHESRNFHFLVERRNNGVITEIEGTEVLNITRSPSLRDLFNPEGVLNGPLFHNGQAATFDELLDHYNDVELNPNLDARIDDMGRPLNLTDEERLQLEAFLKTLTGSDIYTNEKWSDPFDENGHLEIVNGTVGTSNRMQEISFALFPNPASSHFFVEGTAIDQDDIIRLYDSAGRLVLCKTFDGNSIAVSQLNNGLYTVQITGAENADRYTIQPLIILR
jgi:cytochrome c peroxidase